MFRLAQSCLMAQIVLAPLLLGGARPWAMAILTVLTGVGLMAICREAPLHIPRALRWLWLSLAAIVLWLIMQSTPVWPMQSPPFEAPHPALYPDAWLPVILDLCWIAGTATLAQRIAARQRDAFLPLLATVIILAVLLQVVLAISAAIADLPTTFWFVKHAHIGDWTGSFANRNAFGALTGLALLACLYRFANGHIEQFGLRLDRRGGWLGLAILFLLALLESHSRSGLAAAILGTGTFAHMMTAQKSPLRRSILIAVIGLLLVAVLLLIAPGIATRLVDLARFDLIQRDDAWHTALIAIAERPLTGYGAGGIARVMDHFATPGLNNAANWFSSHSLILDGALILGLPVLLLLSVVMLAGLIAALRHATGMTDRAWFLAMALHAILLAAIGWVVAMPALILPVLCCWAGCCATAPASRREFSPPHPGPVQSVAPDPDHAP